MKALKSNRARLLLADPAARVQLRGYLERGAKPVGSEHIDKPVVIQVHSKSGAEMRLTPVVVPKAA